MIAGRATPEGTAAYAAAHPAASGHYRRVQGLALSSVGMGTYLGETDAGSRRGYQEAAGVALASGINVLDAAANYRDQASERDLGAALKGYVAGGGDRSGVLVATKAGFLHSDVDAGDPHAWFQQEYVASGILSLDDVRAGHSLEPKYIERELLRSRENLGLETLDVLFLHNVEHPLGMGVPEGRFYASVQAAFEVLERACDAGQIAMYGVATWNGLRTPPSGPGHLSLVKLVHHAGLARVAAGGKAGSHHFRAIELPVNVAMTEAYLRPTQPFRFGDQTLLAAAKDLDMVVLASASLLQMRVSGRLPPEYAAAFGTSGDAQTALQFTRSIPGVTTALVGMGDPRHASANANFATTTSPVPATVKTLLGTGSLHGW